MPLYEYRCLGCRKKVTLLVGMTADPDREACPSCGGTDLERLVSRFTRGRTEDDRIDELGDRLELQGEPESPAEMRRLVREMGNVMNEDVSDEMEEMFEEDITGGGDEEA